MRLITRIIIVACVTFLASCTTFTTRDFLETDKLHHNTGIIIAGISSNNPDVEVSLVKNKQKTASISMRGSSINKERYIRLAVMEVDSGFTSFDTISLKNKYMRIEDGLRTWVEVKPMQVTYIGAIYVDVNEDENNVKFATNLDAEKVIPVVKQRIPWLLERYPLNNEPAIKNATGSMH